MPRRFLWSSIAVTHDPIADDENSLSRAARGGVEATDWPGPPIS